MKKRFQNYNHNISPRASKKRSGVQKLSTDKQKLIASLKARNPYTKNYSPNLAPHSKPHRILPTIDTSKQYMPYVPGPRTPGAKQEGFFTKKMTKIKGPSTPKGPKPKIPGPRTPTGPKPKSAFGGKSRRKRRRKKKKTRRRKKKKTRRRRKKNMRGCSKKRRRR